MWFRKQICSLLVCYIQGSMLQFNILREMFLLLCQTFGVFVFTCVAAVAGHNEYLFVLEDWFS